MNEGTLSPAGAAQLGRHSEAPDRASNFFENTELTYQNTMDRVTGYINRIDSLSDRVGGHIPQDGSSTDAKLAEQPSSYFDRCNVAEKHLSLAVNRLDESIARLENLGLF